MAFSMLGFLEKNDTKQQVTWKIANFKEGETIVEEGSIGKEIYLIKKGCVHILASIGMIYEQRQDKGIGKLKEGDVFGELALFDDNTRSATAVAATDCEIAVIDGSGLADYMNANPEKGYPVLHYLFTQVADRMRANNIRATTIMGFYLREHAD